MDIIAKLIVRGFIQGVGYRAYVKQLAYRLKIRGNVKNLPDGGVEIYCNAPNEVIYNKFKEKLKEGSGEVEEIEEYFEGDKKFGMLPKDWRGFNILRDETSSIEETLDFVVLGGREIINKIDNLGNKIDNLGNKIDNLGNKIDNLGNKIDNLTSVTTDNFNILDTKYGLISQNMNKILEELIKEREETKKELIKEREESRKSIERLVEAILKGKDKKI
ncbi:MAG: hypothetical protein CVT88_05260 [Candidatus Altiarchaeales archaeon HGW-Altiarchaeales-1]|nr:MAG: hypothetical protein CVT88_05260 [Candidatus Altiarchaeales archaeon HGW-Altiarchaeales-1]